MVGGLTKRQWRLETFQRDRYWEDGFDSSHRYRHANDRKHYTYKIHPAFRFKCLLQIRFNLFLKLKLTYSRWVQLFFCPPYFPLKNLDALSMQIICSPTGYKMPLTSLSSLFSENVSCILKIASRLVVKSMQRSLPSHLRLCSPFFLQSESWIWHGWMILE